MYGVFQIIFYSILKIILLDLQYSIINLSYFTIHLKQNIHNLRILHPRNFSSLNQILFFHGFKHFYFLLPIKIFSGWDNPPILFRYTILDPISTPDSYIPRKAYGICHIPTWDLHIDIRTTQGDLFTMVSGYY